MNAKSLSLLETCPPSSRGVNLRSKRFCGVGEQRKSEERDFRRFARAKNGAGAKNRKEGKGKEGNACRQTPGV